MTTEADVEVDFDRFHVGDQIVYILPKGTLWDDNNLRGVGRIKKVDEGDSELPWLVALDEQHSVTFDDWWFPDRHVQPYEFVIEEF